MNIEYNYEKQDWLETRNEIWSRNETINRKDWANSSAWRPIEEFPIFHDYLMFQLLNYE